MAEFDDALQINGSPKLSANSVTDRMVEAAWKAYQDAQSVRRTFDWMRPVIEAALREQPAPEPVAWLDQETNCAYTSAELDGGNADELLPLYAHPPQDKLREATQMALGALGRWDALIQHQFTGSSAAMTDMHRAAQATVPAMKALREALK